MLKLLRKRERERERKIIVYPLCVYMLKLPRKKEQGEKLGKEEQREGGRE